jgi:hypothetical protein
MIDSSIPERGILNELGALLRARLKCCEQEGSVEAALTAETQQWCMTLPAGLAVDILLETFDVRA